MRSTYVKGKNLQRKYMTLGSNTIYPSGVEVVKRHGPGDGICPLCGTEETLNHIFFSCVSIQFLWGCLREVVGGSWCNTNFPDLLIEVQLSAPSGRHIRWLLIAVLVWTLWTVRNKLVI